MKDSIKREQSQTSLNSAERENSRTKCKVKIQTMLGDNFYVRMDRGDEIVSNLLEICEKENIPSAVFSGIGGCQSSHSRKMVSMVWQGDI